jgi:ClpP class serine protease
MCFFRYTFNDMNTALALEIYRGIWMVESSSADSLKNILRDARAGAVYDPKERLNTFGFLNISAGPSAKESGNSGSSTKKKIAVTNINGVITKSGGPSSAGMEEIGYDMVAADNDPEVLGHYIKVDSPGGSAVGMKYMQKTMQGLTKPKVTIVTRQGMAASGGWGILSEGDYVMAESEDCEIGCHGVMWSVSGVPNGQKDAMGEVNFTVISATSPNKNKATESAINNNDTSLMQAEVNKLHLDFQASTLRARPNVTKAQMEGDMFPASELVGTMIDAIGTEQQAITKLIELSNAQKVTINKNKTMTAAELLAQHPAVHAEILAAGVSAEKDRVDTWMVYHDIDPEAVAKGIESGKAVSGKEQATFLVKAAQGNSLNAIKRDSAGNIVPAEAATNLETPKTAKELADEKEFAAAFPKLIAKGITLEKFNAQKINAN